MLVLEDVCRKNHGRNLTTMRIRAMHSDRLIPQSKRLVTTRLFFFKTSVG
jgi:hypothetical protein